VARLGRRIYLQFSKRGDSTVSSKPHPSKKAKVKRCTLHSVHCALCTVCKGSNIHLIPIFLLNSKKVFCSGKKGLILVSGAMACAVQCSAVQWGRGKCITPMKESYIST
jgi:hypothetical protein